MKKFVLRPACRAALLLVVAFIAAATTGRAAAASLQISRVPTNVVVSWPANAGSTLQFADKLPPTNGWLAFPRARSTNGANLQVNDPSGVPSRFFRLFDGGPPQPPQISLSGPSSIRIGEAAEVTLNYNDPNGDIALLVLTTTNSHGSRRSPVPATMAGLGGTNGQATFPLQSGRLPFGPTQLGFQLIDMAGLPSSMATLDLQVVGATAGGMAPLITFDPSTNGPASFDLPTGVLDRFRPRFPVSYSDLDGDLYRVRVRILAPSNQVSVVEETARALSMTSTSGISSVPFLTFSNTSPPGAYTVEVTGIDRNGNIGATASRTVQLVNFGGQAAAPRFFPFSAGFTPTNGGAGTEVVFNSIGNDPIPTNNRVFLNDVPLEVLDASLTTLRVRITEAAESGPFLIQKANGGAAVSPRSFLVPPSVRIQPENPPTDENGAFIAPVPVAAGASVQLLARAVPLTPGGDRSVNWSVNGIPGGNTTFGTITTNGFFIAPARAPTGGVAKVIAALRTSPAVTGVVEMLILLKAQQPGVPRLVSTTEGGTVFARDLGASVRIPAGALSVDTTITVRQPDVTPSSQPGRRVLGYAEFLPAGTTFNSPVEITLPLRRVLAPGTMLPLRFFLPATSAYVDEGIVATVTDAGDRATANLTHFTIAVVDEPDGVASAVPPAISLIDPSVVLEGERVPVRLRGSGLASDAAIEIRNADGTPTTGIVAETYLGLGTNAGVLLKVGIISGLDSGTRDFRLRIVQPGAGFAETVFQVQGLPEIQVGSGETSDFNNVPQLVVSGVQVAAGGRVVVHGGKFEIESTGDVVIDGLIDASGARGGDGDGQQPGQPGPRGHGGAGGLGREDSDGFFGLDGAEPENYGRNANDAVGFSESEQGFSRPFGPNDGREPQGIGGPPGTNLELDPTAIALHIVECVSSFGVACVTSASELARLGQQVVNVIDGNSAGKRGYGAVKRSALDETGGGGGGGGGRINVSVSLDILEYLIGIDLPSFLDAVSISIDIAGGGGGAGGDGGRDVIISTPGSIRLGDQALITTAGGDGGNGSSTSTWDVDVTPLFIPPIPGLPALSGGAGGGGRGGNLSLVGGLGVEYPSFDQFQTRGGLGGQGGVAYLDPANRVSRFQLVGDAAANGPFGRRNVSQPLLDPAVWRPKVTDRFLLPIDVVAQSITLVVQGELPAQRATFEIRPGGSVLRHSGFALLFPGHNTVSTVPAHLAYPQRILVLASDADSDGLSDGDEADLRTNPNESDTDGDGLNDGADVIAGGSPLRADTDGDGLRDGEEVAFGTQPHRADTDGDSFWDSAELVLGSNPLIKTNTPTEITPGLLFSSATHSNSPGGAYLAGIERASGRFGLFGRPADGFGFGLAFDHFGVLYIADGPRLRIYDPLGLTMREVGEFDPTDHVIQCSALAYNFVPTNRALFGVKLGGPPNFENTGQLLRIDHHTGQATLVGAPLAQSIRALAFSESNTLFAALQDSGGADLLVELNQATGTITRTIGSPGVAPVTGLAVTRDGALLGALPVSAGESQLLVIDPNTGGATAATTTARQLFGLAVAPCPVPCLSLANATNTAPVPRRLLAVDFNRDGRDDLIQLGFNGPTTFGTTATFYRSDGDGRFTAVTNHSLGANFTATGDQMAVADLNGDGWPDMVAILPGVAFSVVFNDGAGSFLAPQQTTVFGAKALDFGYLNGDGMPTMAFVADGQLLLFQTNGSGGFMAATHPVPPQPELYFLDVKLADMNGDSRLDLVLMDSAQIAVALNAGNGTFALPVLTDIAYENAFAVADFDHDGTNDIVNFLIGTPRGFEIFHGRGNGQFDPPVQHLMTNVVASANLEDFAITDLDKDGLPDLAFTESGTGSVHLWMNDSPYGFRTARRSPLKGLSAPGPVAVGDFNGDGKPDLAAGEASSVSRRAVWLNQ